LKLGLVAERQVLGNAVLIGFVNRRRTTQAATALGILGLHQVSPARAFAQDLATGRDLEPFRHGLLCFNTLWTSHKIRLILFQKERAI
jgi:hypothetical protein